MSEAGRGITARPGSAGWRRWTKVLAIAAIVLLCALVALAALARVAGYRNFYVPSESMMPTFAVDDRFVARMGGGPPLARGDLVLVRAPLDGPRVSRIVRVTALAGDRIAIRRGVVLLNGRAVTQRQVAVETLPNGSAYHGGSGQARRLAERFPGEAMAHHIYDQGISPYDNVEEQVVRPGHVFLLGDNRDNSADSRVPAEEMGLGQLPLANVHGRPLFFLGSATHDWFEPIGD